MNTAIDTHSNNTHHWFEQLASRQKTSDDNGIKPSWLMELQDDARNRISSLPVPTRKTELWRYTLLEGLFKETFLPLNTELDAQQLKDDNQWLLNDSASYRLLFANGKWVPGYKHYNQLPDGVRIGSLRQMLHQQPEQLANWIKQASALHDHDIFNSLNTASLSDGLFVHLPPDTILDRPIEILHMNFAGNQPVLIQPFNLIVLEHGSRASIVERVVGADGLAYFHNGVSEILVEGNARLNHVSLQEESQHAFHLHQRFLSLGDASRYQGVSLSLGGHWARQELRIRFQAESADCQTNGLYLTGKQQLSDFHLDVLHNTPANSSRHNYKGIVYGNGRAVFDGRILVNQDAQKSDAHLFNKNLMLSRHGEVDTKPQLEIYADDVKCSHGTTVGQLDTEQLFYLRSRGISHADAVTLLCRGFAGEILETINDDVVRQYAENRLNTILDGISRISGETANG